jgi:hypothetical protein
MKKDQLDLPNAVVSIADSYTHCRVQFWQKVQWIKANPNGRKNIVIWHTFGTGDAPASSTDLLFFAPIRSIGRIGTFQLN